MILAYRLGNFAGVGATLRRTMTMWLVPSMGNSWTFSSFRPYCLMALRHSASYSLPAAPFMASTAPPTLT